MEKNSSKAKTVNSYFEMEWVHLEQQEIQNDITEGEGLKSENIGCASLSCCLLALRLLTGCPESQPQNSKTYFMGLLWKLI